VKMMAPIGSVAQVRGAIGLEAVDADLGRRVQVPARLGPERFHVAVVALGLSAEQRVFARRRCRVEAAWEWLWQRDRQPVELQVGQLLSDEIVIRIDVREIPEAILGGASVHVIFESAMPSDGRGCRAGRRGAQAVRGSKSAW
jgi:hypothetical protein